MMPVYRRLCSRTAAVLIILFSTGTLSWADSGMTTSAGSCCGSSSSGLAEQSGKCGESLATQRLAMIEMENESGVWILAASVALQPRERTRGFLDTFDLETTTRVIRQKLFEAGIAPVDTIVQALNRRIHRYLDVYQYKKDGAIYETASGLLAVKESVENNDPVTRMMARKLVEDENRDRQLLRREVGQQ